MANPWFRMYSEFSHDPKVQMMTEAMQRRYMMLMCLQCSNSLVTLHETEIAFHLRISDADLTETKALFISKGFIDKSWNLLNWEKRQFASDQSNARVAKHRALLKEKQIVPCNVTEPLPKQKSNALDTEQNRTDADKSVGSAKRRTQLPTDFLPNETGLKSAASKGLSVDAELQKFKDFHAGKGTVMLDWQAAWRTWCSNAKQFTPKWTPSEITVTVPSRQGIDPALAKAINDAKNCKPPPADIRARMAELSGARA